MPRHSLRSLTAPALAFVSAMAGISPLPLHAQAPSKSAPSPTLQQRLIHAVIQDQIEAVPALLAQGGDPNARTAPASEDAWALTDSGDDDPAPPLIVIACRFGSIQGPKIIQMLLDKGANPNIADRNGVTPLMAAAQLGMGGFHLLLEHGAKVNAADKTGRTPLMYAMNNRGQGTAATLLEKGADINAQDNAGVTPLMYAVRDAINDPILLIHEDQAKKAAEAKVRYRELIAFLIAHKADVNRWDRAGNTALALAQQNGQPEVAALLRKAGAKA